ncbi:MAG: ferrous iron transport protein A [Firmicutes bacterium]|nr:ferrous iron transport protein A [Bacillota bacterium]
MRQKIVTLNLLPIDKCAKIVNINCDKVLQRRLFDLGLISGTTVKALFKSPGSDPTAYLIRGAVIALRSDDTKKIDILLEN